MDEYSQLVSVPVWPAMAIVGSAVTVLMGIVVWVFTTFEQKKDADLLCPRNFCNGRKS